MKCILISDIDGTFYFTKRNFKISEFDKRAINTFKLKGNLFGVCTGRSLSSVLRIEKEENVSFDFIIAASGASIKVNKDIIFERFLDKSVFNRIEQVISNVDCEKSASTKDFFYSTDVETNISKSCVNIMSLNDIDSELVSNISLEVKNTFQLYPLFQKLSNSLGEMLEININNKYIDISPKGCNKGEAIKILKQIYSYTDIQYFAIGDSFNDISMFEEVNNSFSFNSSPDLVKSKCNYCVDSLFDAINIITSNCLNLEK